jgi:glycine hydroxymethyltransferase
MSSSPSSAQTASAPDSFFTATLTEADPEIAAAIRGELGRQRHEIELIASENIVSRAVLEAQGSVLTNKYAEGYPGNRYYGGCEWVDVVETLAIERAKKLFGAGFRQCAAEFRQPDEPGGVPGAAAARRYLHGPRSRRRRPSHPRLAGQHVRQMVQGLALHGAARGPDHRHGRGGQAGRTGAAEADHRRRLGLFAAWDFKRFREIADSVGAYLLVDMAHFAGLVAGGVHASPVPHAHVTTTTTHKSLRGPRGGLILTNDEALAKKLNSAIFPGLQGGPLMHVIAAKAVAFAEALRPDFKIYAERGRERQGAGGKPARARLRHRLRRHRQPSDAGRSRPKGLKGNVSEKALVRAAITCNKNGIPFDPEKPFVTSGLRLGTPAATTRGFGVAEFQQVGGLIAEVLNAVAQSQDGSAPLVEAAIKERVKALTDRFPIYQ